MQASRPAYLNLASGIWLSREERRLEKLGRLLCETKLWCSGAAEDHELRFKEDVTEDGESNISIALDATEASCDVVSK